MAWPENGDGILLFVDVENETIIVYDTDGDHFNISPSVQHAKHYGEYSSEDEHEEGEDQQDEYSEDEGEEGEEAEYWDRREYPACDVPPLFEAFKQGFRELVAISVLYQPSYVCGYAIHLLILSRVPSGDGKVWGAPEEERKAIIKKHGCPSESYNKAAYMEELEAFAEAESRYN